MKRFILILMSVCLILSTTACGGLQDDIVGKWESDNQAGNYIVFNENGTGEMILVTGKSSDMKYTVDEDTIRIVADIADGEDFHSALVSVEIKRDKMSYTSATGKRISYTRVKK